MLLAAGAAWVTGVGDARAIVAIGDGDGIPPLVRRWL